MKKYLFLMLSLTSIAFGQKKVIDHTAYNDWKKVTENGISNTGNHSFYSVKPHRGDGFLYLHNNNSGKVDSLARGIEAQFSYHSSFLIFKINPPFEVLRKAELDKKPKDKWPKDTLAIWDLEKDTIYKFASLKEFKLSSECDVIAFTQNMNEYPEGYLSKKALKKEQKKAKKLKTPFKTDGKLLTLIDLASMEKKCFKNISSFEISRDGQTIAFLDQQKFKKDSVRFNVYNKNAKSLFTDKNRYIEISGITFSPDNKRVVALSSLDTLEQKYYRFFQMDLSKNSIETLVDSSKIFEKNRVVSGNYKPRFILDNQSVLFGVWNKPDKFIKDTLLDSEKAKLDLWHWEDERLQPQQLLEMKRDLAKTNLYSYNFSDGSIVQIGRDTLDFSIRSESKERYVLAYCSDDYAYQTWESPQPSNYYRIDTKDGSILLLRKKVYFEAKLSPDGNNFIFFDEKKKQWYAENLSSHVETCLTCENKFNLFTDGNGTPQMAEPNGIIGFADKGRNLLIQAENDLLVYNFESAKIKSLVADLRKNDADTNYRYSLNLLNMDSTMLSTNIVNMVRFDRKSKAEKVFLLSGTFDKIKFNEILSSDHSYMSFKKAKQNDRFLLQRQSLHDFPDIQLFTQDKGLKQLSYCNPQQKDYNWATVELISWKSFTGIELEGLVYKPENFDPNKSYPMVIYYYEMYADDLHNHYAPRPTASIVYPTEYASAGYVVFIPNIRYQVGHPGNSAYDCIMSGTDAVLKKYTNVDAKRIGLQGQSWGGYQTAQLITMTNRFACAMAGAPVSNMTSAYGGIRWGSGLVRQFQYERQQSRIGKTLWEARDLYIENSPLFHLDKVNTPLLIMSNDKDDAVPWYQGIELYSGLRRLQKPVWLLNYNDDYHNLMRNANRFDLSIRMRQYFDFYLNGAPQPLWLKEGIPATVKGKEYRLEVVEEE